VQTETRTPSQHSVMAASTTVDNVSKLKPKSHTPQQKTSTTTIPLHSLTLNEPHVWSTRVQWSANAAPQKPAILTGNLEDWIQSHKQTQNYHPIIRNLTKWPNRYILECYAHEVCTSTRWLKPHMKQLCIAHIWKQHIQSFTTRQVQQNHHAPAISSQINYPRKWPTFQDYPQAHPNFLAAAPRTHKSTKSTTAGLKKKGTPNISRLGTETEIHRNQRHPVRGNRRRTTESVANGTNRNPNPRGTRTPARSKTLTPGDQRR
jgi:hypothetical protein